MDSGNFQVLGVCTLFGVVGGDYRLKQSCASPVLDGMGRVTVPVHPPHRRHRSGGLTGWMQGVSWNPNGRSGSSQFGGREHGVVFETGCTPAASGLQAGKAADPPLRRSGLNTVFRVNGDFARAPRRTRAFVTDAAGFRACFPGEEKTGSGCTSGAPAAVCASVRRAMARALAKSR